MESLHRPTRIIVHSKAIQENIKNEIARLPKGRELFAVVKANGYGHGALAVAKAALTAGATGLCVATIDEGIQLREAGFTEPILILGVVSPTYLPLVAEYQLAFPVGSLAWLEKAAQVLQETPVAGSLLVHLKVDSGMGRIGFGSPTELSEAVTKLASIPEMVLEGVFTHFATADQADDSYYETQAQRFTEFLAVFPELPRYVHCDNSASALWHEQPLGNMVRFGVALYGLNPSGHSLEASYSLQPALELVSRLVQVKQVSAGTGIGYGKSYTSPQTEWIGTVPIGYADGWIRKMQGFKVLVAGQFCEIVGRVCMDQIMIRLPHEFPEDTLVTLIGENGGQRITLQDVADQQETIHYEVACLLSSRIPREYID